SEIAETGGREHRIAQSVRGDVPVRVTRAPVGVLEQQTGHPARPSGLHGMHVRSDADTHDAHISFSVRTPDASTVRASTRSSGVVILKARGSPTTVVIRSPSRSTSPASSVASAASRLARSSRSTSNPCGVCTARRVDRSGVPVTVPSASTLLMVSTTGRTGITALLPARNASTTRTNRSAGVSARAASWTSTNRAPDAAARPARTESARSAPPATTVTRSANDSPTSRSAGVAASSGGATITTRSTTAEASIASTERSSIVRPSSSTNALGSGSPRRTPRPAAGRIPTTGPLRSLMCSLPMSRASGSGGENLVEHGFRLDVVGALGERELTDEDLTRLGEHPLLTCGQAAVLLPAPQVAHNFCDLVDVAGGQLLEVGLVPP